MTKLVKKCLTGSVLTLHQPVFPLDKEGNLNWTLGEVVISPNKSANAAQNAYNSHKNNLLYRGYSNAANYLDQNRHLGYYPAMQALNEETARAQENRRALEHANTVSAKEDYQGLAHGLALLTASPALYTVAAELPTLLKSNGSKAIYDFNTPVKPTSQLVKDAVMLTGLDMAGYNLLDGVSQNLYGKPWTQAVRDALPEGPNWIPDWLKDVGAGALNPLGYLGSYASNLYNGILRPKYNKVKAQLDDAISDGKLYKDKIDNLSSYRHELLDNEGTIRVANAKVNDRLDSYKYQKRAPVRMERSKIIPLSKVDLLKFADPRYNPNYSKMPLAQRIHNVEGIPHLEMIDNPFSLLTSGKVSIPKLGTNEIIEGEVFPVQAKAMIPLSNNAVDIISPKKSLNISQLPENLKLGILHNIDYITGKFPGSSVYGSSMTSSLGIPHIPKDIEIYTTDVNFLKYINNGLKGEFINPSTFKARLHDLDLPMSTIDINIVKTKPNGTIDFTSERGYNLLRQIFPDEFEQAFLKALGDPTKMKSAVKALDLIDKVSIKNTIQDLFESSLRKHIDRALWLLNYGDPDEVYSGLLKHGNSLVGEKMVHAPVDESMFQNVQSNLELLSKMQIPGLLDESNIAKDPKRMKLLFEYWWLNNTILSRGVDNTNFKTVIPAMTTWLGRTNNYHGGSAMGTGLNTVKLGNSGFGPIYGHLQPEINGLKPGMIPSELIDLINNNYPKQSVLLPRPTQYQGRTLTTYGDVLKLYDNITPQELQNLVPNHVNGLTGGLYSDNTNISIYTGLTRPITRPTDNVYIFNKNDRAIPPSMQEREILIPDNQDVELINRFTSSMKHIDTKRKILDYYDTSPELSKINEKLHNMMDQIQQSSSNVNFLIDAIKPLYQQAKLKQLLLRGKLPIFIKQSSIPRVNPSILFLRLQNDKK